MRDKRFDTTGTIAKTMQAWSTSRAAADADARLQPLISDIAASWNTAELADQRRFAIPDVDSINPELQPVLAAVKAIVDPGTVGGATGSIAGILLGRGVAAALTSGPVEIARFDAAAEFMSHRDSWFEFVETITEELQKNEPLKQQWIEALASLPADLSEVVDGLGRQRNSVASLNALDESFRTSKNPAGIWRRIWTYDHLSTKMWLRMSALVRISPAGFVQAVDECKSATALRLIFDRLWIYQDPDLIIEGLRLSASAYQDGEWTGRLSIFLFADAATQHATRLTEAVRFRVRSGGESVEETALRETELPGWLSRAYKTLLDREDGQDVGVELIVSLSAHPKAEEKRWSAEELALEQLVNALAARDVGCSRFVQHANVGRAASPFLVAAALVEGAQPAQTSIVLDDTRIWKWYLELLSGKDSGVTGQVNPYSRNELPFHSIGRLASRRKDPVVAWRNAWSALYTQRNTYRFEFTDYALLDPSIHLVRTGRMMVQYLVEESREAAQMLWREVYQACRSMTIGLPFPDTKNPVLERAVLFAFLPVTFEKDWPEIVRAVGADLAADERLCLFAAAFIRRNGVSADEVKAGFASAHLDPLESGSRLLQWKKVQGFTTAIENASLEELIGQLQ